MRSRLRWTALLAAVAVLLTMLSGLDQPGTATTPGHRAAKAARGPHYHLVLDSEFNGSSLEGWTERDTITNKQPEGASQQSFDLGRNVWVANGHAALAANRVCKPKSQPRSAIRGLSPHPGVCPRGTATKYTSSRLERFPNQWPALKDFRVEFKVTLPRINPGTRASTWLHTDQSYCKVTPAKRTWPGIGELDAVEYYGRGQMRTSGWNRPRATSTTHMTCDWAAGQTHRQTSSAYREVHAGGTYRFAVERIAGATHYYVNGKPTATMRCGRGKFAMLTQKRCNQVLGRPWRLIMDQEVFKGRFGPADGRRFPSQYLKVDWVKVWKITW